MNNKKVVTYSVSALMVALLAKLWLGFEASESIATDKTDQFSELVKNNAENIQSHPGLVGHVNLIPVVESDEVWISEGIKAQMLDVTDAFKENMRYPAYSKPLNENDWSMLNPRAFVPKLVELNIQGLSAQLLVDQYIVDRNKNLTVDVQIQGLDTLESTISEVRVSLGSDNPIVTNKVSDSKEVLTYRGGLSSSYLMKAVKTEMPLKASILLDNGEEAKISAVIKLASTEATLTRLGASYVDDSDLAIPAYFDVSSPGFYRVRANLFDENSNAPISHINASFMLSEHENEGLLKVHASTLRRKGFEGPYILKDFDITRGPRKPGDKTGYGASDRAEFSVQGFDLNSYSHEPFHDPRNQQRLEFLQKMAGIQ